MVQKQNDFQTKKSTAFLQQIIYGIQHYKFQ